MCISVRVFVYGCAVIYVCVCKQMISNAESVYVEELYRIENVITIKWIFSKWCNKCMIFFHNQRSFLYSCCNHCNINLHSKLHTKKQPCKGVLIKSCSEKLQQIYRKKPMPKCVFNKVAKQLYWNLTLAWVFSCKFVQFFRTAFYKNCGGLLLHISDIFG